MDLVLAKCCLDHRGSKARIRTLVRGLRTNLAPSKIENCTAPAMKSTTHTQAYCALKNGCVIGYVAVFFIVWWCDIF